MRAPLALHAALAAAAALALAGCASTGGAAKAADPTAGLSNAEVRTHTVENGDTIEEYRVAGQLRVVKVVPARGPIYYLVDENGDGRLDTSKGEGTVSPVYFKLFSW